MHRDGIFYWTVGNFSLVLIWLAFLVKADEIDWVKEIWRMVCQLPVAYYDKYGRDSYNNTFGTFAEAKWFASENQFFSGQNRFCYFWNRDLDPNFAALYQI
jgi:hypothetical protein